MMIHVMFCVIALLYGIAIGSFLNVCIYRLPLGQEIVKTPSHCMTCGYQLRWYDNIPVFSFLILKGRCRKCGTRLSLQYPLVELCNGLLYVLVLLVHGYSVESILYCLMGSALIVLGMIDERHHRIPNGILYCLFFIGAAECVVDRENLVRHLIGMVVVSLVFLILNVLSHGEAVTLGDAALMASTGLIIGWHLILIAAVLGLAIAALVYLVRKQKVTASHVLVLGPYLSIGVMLSALWGYPAIVWYVQFLMRP